MEDIKQFSEVDSSATTSLITISCIGNLSEFLRFTKQELTQIRNIKTRV
jgi:hypothetical protein